MTQTRRTARDGVGIKVGAIALCLCMVLPKSSAAFLYPLQETQLWAVAALSPVTQASARAYEQNLSSEAIREAYFLGRRRDATTGVFLSQYAHVFPTAKKWPHVGRIDLLTPYAQVVSAAKDDLLNDSVLDAEQKYGSPEVPLLVRVRAYWSALSAFPTADKDVWGQFAIVVSQEHPLTVKKKTWVPYRVTREDTPGFDYIDMELQFDAKDVAPAPITIAVSSPDGQHVETKFDLDKLK